MSKISKLIKIVKDPYFAIGAGIAGIALGAQLFVHNVIRPELAIVHTYRSEAGTDFYHGKSIKLTSKKYEDCPSKIKITIERRHDK